MRRAQSVIALACTSLFVACSGGGGGGPAANQAPTASFGGPGASLPSSTTALAGATIQFNITANDPDDVATLAIFADVDGDLATVTDQVSIAAGLEDKDGDLQSVPWDTTGVASGDYKLVALLSDGENPDVIVRSDGVLTIARVVSFNPTGTLRSTSETLRIDFDHALADAAPSAMTIPIIFNSLPVDGTYTLIEEGFSVLFTPSSGSFEAPGTIRFEVRSNLLLESAPIPRAVFNGLFNTRVSRVYATSLTSPEILVLNSLTMAEIGQVALEDDTLLGDGVSTASGLMFFAARAGGVPASSGKIIPFDSATSTPLAAIQLTPNGQEPNLRLDGIALSPDEEFLYCAVSEGSGDLDTASTPYLSIIELSTLSEQGRIRLTGEGRVSNVAISPDGTLAFLCNIDNDQIHVVHLIGLTEIDTDGISSNGVTPMPTTAAAPFDLALNQDGTRLYVSFDTKFGSPMNAQAGTPSVSVYNTSTYSEAAALTSLAQADDGSRIAFNSQDGSLYALRNSFVNGEGLSVLDPNTGEEVVVSFAGVNDLVSSIAFLPGTARVLISAQDGEILVIDSGALMGSAISIPTTLPSIASLVTIPAAHEFLVVAAEPNQPPVCFAGTARIFDPGNLTVDFDATGSFDPDPSDAIESYSWEFGDNQSATTNEAAVSHTYASAGNYEVTLTVSDGELTSSKTTNVFTNPPPTCDAGSNIVTAVNVSVLLDASNSTDANGTIASYLWEFDNGQTANGVSPTVTLGTPGMSLGRLTVTDNEGASSACAFSIDVINTPPTCSIISTPGGTTEDSLVYDGSLSSSNDLGDSIISYEWDFEGDGVVDATGEQVFHTFPVPGVYAVTLTVTDSFGLQSSCITVVDIIKSGR